LGSALGVNQSLIHIQRRVSRAISVTLVFSTGIADAQIVVDFATKLNEQRQSFYNFWVHAAQLVLLNLLLPLLTVLFGYVFGTQHNNANSSWK
jgi:hypothetical protein